MKGTCFSLEIFWHKIQLILHFYRWCVHSNRLWMDFFFSWGLLQTITRYEVCGCGLCCKSISTDLVKCQIQSKSWRKKSSGIKESDCFLVRSLIQLNIIMESRFMRTKFDNTNLKDQKATNQITCTFCMLFIALIKCDYDKSTIDPKNIRIQSIICSSYSFLLFTTIKLSIVLFEDNKMFTFWFVITWIDWIHWFDQKEAPAARSCMPLIVLTFLGRWISRIRIKTYIQTNTINCDEWKWQRCDNWIPIRFYCLHIHRKLPMPG